MVNTIIFDVDGTLLNTERIYMRAWQLASADFGYTLPDEALLQTRAVSKERAIACFRSYCGEDFPYEPIRLERVRIAEQLIAEAKMDELRMPYVLPTLNRLQEKGYKLAVASSTGAEKTKEHLAHAGLLDYFPVAVGGDMVTHGKPEPDIFLLAAQLCGAQPETCLVVGDTPADVFAATAAGMPVVLIPDQVPANEQTRPLSRAVLNGLDELCGLLDKETI